MAAFEATVTSGTFLNAAWDAETAAAWQLPMEGDRIVALLDHWWRPGRGVVRRTGPDTWSLYAYQPSARSKSRDVLPDDLVIRAHDYRYDFTTAPQEVCP